MFLGYIPAAVDQTSRATVEFRQAQNSIITQSTEKTKIVQLEASIKDLKDSATSFEANEGGFNHELVKETAESTWIELFRDDRLPQMI